MTDPIEAVARAYCRDYLKRDPDEVVIVEWVLDFDKQIPGVWYRHDPDDPYKHVPRSPVEGPFWHKHRDEARKRIEDAAWAKALREAGI